MTTDPWLPVRGSTPISLMETTTETCKWPVGERPFLFCGLPVAKGAYCATHHAIAHRATVVKQSLTAKVEA